MSNKRAGCNGGGTRGCDPAASDGLYAHGLAQIPPMGERGGGFDAHDAAVVGERGDEAGVTRCAVRWAAATARQGHGAGSRTAVSRARRPRGSS